MKNGWQEIEINGVRTKALITIKEDGDIKHIGQLYWLWQKLNMAIKLISTRGINLPEAISENAFCLFFPTVRVVKLAKGKCSYDCISTETGKRIQIKASSMKSDLTSFGPRSEWDELYFLDFSTGNGSFKVYKIDAEWIYAQKMNEGQTFTEQQAQGRRPRFSITQKIIKPLKLNPIKICNI